MAAQHPSTTALIPSRNERVLEISPDGGRDVTSAPGGGESHSCRSRGPRIFDSTVDRAMPSRAAARPQVARSQKGKSVKEFGKN
jgi:hypothetical protein